MSAVQAGDQSRLVECALVKGHSKLKIILSTKRIYGSELNVRKQIKSSGIKQTSDTGRERGTIAGSFSGLFVVRVDVDQHADGWKHLRRRFAQIGGRVCVDGLRAAAAAAAVGEGRRRSRRRRRRRRVR